MKHLIVLLIGLLLGAVLFAAGLVYNPFISQAGVSTLAVTNSQTMSLVFSGIPSDAVVFSNDGDSRIAPHPTKVLQLWEAPIRNTSAMATVMRDGRNQAVGFGIKLSSLSEDTRLIEGNALVDSVWYVYLPGRGGFFVEQTENYWDYVREVVLPAYRSSANTWKGTWLGNLTSGPGALRTAKVIGSSGEFEGQDMLGVESVAVRAWRVDGGPVAAQGQLLIELTASTVPVNDDTTDEDALATPN